MSIDYDKIREIRNTTSPFANLLGLQLTEIRKGYAAAEMDITDNARNSIHSVHGGVLFTVADVAGSGAAASYGKPVTTIDSSFHYLRSGLGTTHLCAKARELKAGKNILVYDVTVFDQDETVLAEGIFSYMVLHKSN